MNQYFLKMTQEEKSNILDQHKELYDGFVTRYPSQQNTQPLYVQDFANDKQGITVSNQGVVKPYTNMGINESELPLDMIGDGEDDLENGTVTLHTEYPSPSEVDEDYEFDIDETGDFESEPMNEDDFFDDIDTEVVDKINESLDMFKRFKNFN